jgi:hypothetical protein
VTDIDGHPLSLKKVQSALEHQLYERISLVPPPDDVVASLLSDLGDLLAVEEEFGPASVIYSVAAEYAPNRHVYFEQRAHWNKAASEARATRNIALPLLISFIVLLAIVLVAAIGLYLRPFSRRHKPSRTIVA